TAAVDGTGISNVRAQFNSVTGQVTLTFDVANNAPLVAHTLTLTNPDGQTTTGTITVVANTPPVLAGIEGPPALQYTENDPPVAVTSTRTLTDLDNQTGFTAQARATIQITAGFQAATPGQPGQDVLGFVRDLTPNTGTGSIVGSYNAGSGILTLTATAAEL